MNVLIIDDNHDLVKLMKHRFESSGHTVTAAFAGYEVLGLVKSAYAPDAIILDLFLPEISGSELISTLINRWEFAKIYIHSAHAAKAKAFSRSVCGCFHKGTDSVEDMIKAIEAENSNISQNSTSKKISNK